jgi:transposase
VDGKPKIVKQVYLGTIEKLMELNILNKTENGTICSETFDHSDVLGFGTVIALYDLAERLKVRQIIDESVGKRQQGLMVGDSMVLAAINRAVVPVSKRAFYEDWYSKTVLPKISPMANELNISSQGFWNNMSLLKQDEISKIEDQITNNIIKSYNLSTDCLLFDNTNFITYIDTDTPCKLPQRGKSKEHRSDLRIVGLSLMVSPDNNERIHC